MKAYLVTTAAVFGLLVVLHLWRVVEEGGHVARDPVFLLFTVLSAGLCGWAVYLLRRVGRA